MLGSKKSVGAYICLPPELEQCAQKIDMVDIYYNVQKQKITFL